MRNYFGEQDWVVRRGEDTFAVLLPETLPEYAELLAERVRATWESGSRCATIAPKNASR
jgi:GGDEF domain-containing protein